MLCYQVVNDVSFYFILKKVPIATCAIMYSLEGDQLILPIESSMSEPIKYFQPILLFSMSFICCLFCVFGSCCVIAFGHVSNGSVTAFLLDHADEWKNAAADYYPTSTQIVFVSNVIVSLSLLFTYPLQLFPAFGLTGQIISKFHKNKTISDEDVSSSQQLGTTESHLAYCNTATLNTYPSSHYGSIETSRDEFCDEPENDSEMICNEHFENDGMKIECDSLKMRFSLVFLTYFVAMVVPHLELLIALAGAITGSATSLIIPPMVALKFEIIDAMPPTLSTTNTSINLWTIGKSPNFIWILLFVVIILVGFIYGIIGTWYSVKDLIETFS